MSGEGQSDYAVTRDLIEWWGKQRESLDAIQGGGCAPVNALRFAHELRLRVQVFEAHFANKVEAWCQELRESTAARLALAERMVVDARATGDPAAALTVHTLQEKKP